MLGNRIKEAREKANFSQEELAKALSIGKRTLIDYEQNKTEPKLSILHNIAEICDIDIKQLLFGENINLKDEQKVSFSNSCGDECVQIGYIEDMVASAGGGGDSNSASVRKVSVSRFMLEEFKISNYKRANLIKVFGDSMEPLFKSGDIAVVESVDSIEQVSNGSIVIATINSDVYIKRLEKHPFGKWVAFKSENREYSDITIEGKELELVRINSIVRGKIRVF